MKIHAPVILVHVIQYRESREKLFYCLFKHLCNLYENTYSELGSNQFSLQSFRFTMKIHEAVILVHISVRDYFRRYCLFEHLCVRSLRNMYSDLHSELGSNQSVCNYFSNKLLN